MRVVLAEDFGSADKLWVCRRKVPVFTVIIVFQILYTVKFTVL